MLCTPRLTLAIEVFAALNNMAAPLRLFSQQVGVVILTGITDPSSRRDLNPKSSHSLVFKTLQDRLEEECGVDLTPQHRSDLHTFRNRRNRVEHFNVIDTLLALQSSIAQMVSFLVDLVKENFEVDELEEEEQRLLAEIRGRLNSCAAVVEERLASIKPEIEKLYSVVQCPFCLQMAMHADSRTVKCLFCHASPEPAEAADEYVMNVLGYSHRDDVGWRRVAFHTCPECGHDTL